MRYIDSLPTYSSDRFTWSSSKKTGVAELSDFGGIFATVPPFCLYKDVMDVFRGFFNVRSERTGARLTFVFSGVDSDQEGEITGWRYTSLDRTIKITIIND